MQAYIESLPSSELSQISNKNYTVWSHHRAR
jgi:hypothetical protein